MQRVGAAHRRPFGPFEEFEVAAELERGRGGDEAGQGGDPPRLGVRSPHREGISVFETQGADQAYAAAGLCPATDCSYHCAAIGHVAAVHLAVPQRAGIIDVDVDIVAVKRAIDDRRAEAVAIADAIAGAGQPITDQPGKNILLGEVLGPDRHDLRVIALPQRRGGEREAGDERDQSADPQWPAAVRDAALDQADERVGDERQPGGGDAARQHQRPVLRLQTREDHVAEAGLADRRRERRRADRPYRGGADAGDQHRQRERRFDQAQLLRGRHADRIRRLGNSGVDADEASDAVADDRQQRIERQRDQRRQEAERRDTAADHPRQPQQQRVEERKQRQRRDRLDQAGNPQDRGADPWTARGEDGERQADCDAERQRRGRQQDVLGEQRRQAAERGDEGVHRAISRSRSA